MKIIDAEKFLDFVETQQDKWLYTLAKKAKYKVRVVKWANDRGFEYFVQQKKKEYMSESFLIASLSDSIKRTASKSPITKS